MFNFFGGGKSNSLRDNHIKMLERWNSASPMKSDKSQWRVGFRTRKANFVFLIIFPAEFPEVAPVFKFQSPVEHPWVDSHDGVTILNDNLLQWNPHCDITRIGQACVHEFVSNPPRLQSNKSGGRKVSSTGSGQVAVIYRTKPFGLKLRPKNKLQNLGAVIHALENFHVSSDVKQGMTLVTIGQRPVQNMKFNHIIQLLSDVSVPVQLVFQGHSSPIKPKPAQQPAPSYNYGMPVYQQPARPAPAVYNQPVRPAPAVAIPVPAKPQEPPKPKIPEKQDITLPEIENSTFDILDTYSINQLKDLLSDNLALEQVTMDIANKDLNRMRRKLREDTKEAANKNLSYKEPIEASKLELEKLREEVTELQTLNRDLNAEKQKLAPKIDKFAVKRAFAEAAEKTDEESQGILDKFESDDIAYVTFIKKYKASRESHHNYMIMKGLIN